MIELADASLLILFLNDANSKYIGDLIGTGDVGDIKCGMWHGGAGDMCEKSELISCHVLSAWTIAHP